MRRYLQLLISVIALSATLAATDSEDGYVSRKADTWTLGTAKVERTITLSKGNFFTSSLKNKTSGKELLPAGTVSDEVAAQIDGKTLTSSSGGWKLVSANDHVLANGEIQLDVALRHGALQVTKTYVVYPGTSIIREWVQFKNVGTKALQVAEPRFLGFTATGWRFQRAKVSLDDWRRKPARKLDASN